MTDSVLIPMSLNGLSWIGRDGGLLTEHPYVFVSKKGENCFIEIQKNWQELNDFCVTLFQTVKAVGADPKHLVEEEDVDSLYSIAHFGYSVEDLG